MTYTAQYGTSFIKYSVSRSDRKTLAIEVHPDLSVKVVAPKKTTLKEINGKVVKRAAWIVKQQHFFDQFLPRTPPREFVSGETHYYLGKRYLLKVRKGKEEQVKLKGGELFVYTKSTSNRNKIKQLLASWYRNHALRKFNNSIDRQLKSFKSFKVDRPKLVVKRMAKRWGSCTINGTVVLNPEIIKAPSKCIDYVVLHELCHLVHHRHDGKFYALQGKIMPDWERWKMRLEKVLI